VRTDHGEYMLDNMTDEVLTWHETGYTFVKRQAKRGSDRLGQDRSTHILSCSDENRARW
jgi:hypothetical protein